MKQEKLITDAEKLELKSKLAPLFGEIEKQKKTLARVDPAIEIIYEDAELPKSEAELHRNKIYKIEERSHKLEKVQKEIAKLNVLLAEAMLYATLINNDSIVEVI